MADTTVKYFHSGMPGAPVLSGTAGAMIAVLDACLTTGWGLVTLDTLIVASDVATATKSGGVTFEVGTVVTVAGATPAGLNGEHKVTATTSTTVTFETTGITNQTATGTITLKLSSAAWSKTYTGTNKAAYKPDDGTASACLLRVDDTGTTAARVVGYETMTDVDTGTGPFPTTAQRSGGSYWTKSNAADATARSWMLVSDGKLFYMAREYFPSISAGAYELHGFGDVIPTKSGDAFACMLSGESANQSASNINPGNSLWTSDSTVTEMYMPRSYTGIGSAAQMRKAMPTILNSTAQWASGQMTGFTPYPNPGDGGLYTVPLYVSETANFNFRGIAPGFYGVPQAVANGQFTVRDSVTGVVGLSGRTLKALTCKATPLGVCFFDITGPWR